MTPHRSILEVFLANVAEVPVKTAAMVKRGGAYQEVNWSELGASARAIAGGLVELGVEPGDRVCLLCSTRLEWVEADMGILGAGAVTVPIYPSSLADECQLIAADAAAVVVIAEDAAQVGKLRAERSRLVGVRAVIQIDGDVPRDDPWVRSMSALQRTGADFAAQHPAPLAARRAALGPESIFTIIYTSGTTGRPKGVVTTHAAVLWEAQCMADVDLARTSDVQLLFLPLAHSYARTMMIGWLATRHILAFAASMEPAAVEKNLREVRPTAMGAVPRFYEKVFQMALAQAEAAGGVRDRLFHAAIDLSEKNGLAEQRGERLGVVDRMRHAALKATVFRRIGRELQRGLGGRMRAMCSGSAPIAPRILWFFRDAGLLLLEGYGLTESASGGFANQPGKDRPGSVGQVLPGMQAKLLPDGEILLRGPNIMKEYWRQPEATAEALADGWLHTGDVGVMDRDGYLWITDRKKDLIVTAGGKNVAPLKIESLLKECSGELISQAVVHGDRRPYLTALITLDADAVKRLAAELRLGDGSHATTSQRPEVARAVQKIVDEVNRRLPRHETIKKYKVLEHDFTQDSGELTPTLKVKRKVVNERYLSILDGFYDPAL